MTNYEWMKTLSIEEMSFIFDIVDGICDDYPHCMLKKTCNECVKEWLMKEHEDNEETKEKTYGNNMARH